MIVQKFGGTSVADAQAMRAVLSIVQREIHRSPVVVLSACSGATNELIAIVEMAAKGTREQVQQRINLLKERHIGIASELVSDTGLRELMEKVHVLCTELSVFCEGVSLLGECTPRSIAFSSAMGELLSTTIFCSYAQTQGVPATFADARSFMRTDENSLKGVVDTKTLRKFVQDIIIRPLKEGSAVITQGFIGSDAYGRTTTLGRGGSDYSAALIGAAIGAEEIQIWTDVSGIASTDPRRVESAFPIQAMSFKEARELALYGAKVLHPETIIPAVEMGITVKVLNTFAPEDKGTTITPEVDTQTTGFRAVTLKEHCLLVDITTEPNDTVNNISRTCTIMEESGLHLYGLLSSESGCRILTEGDKERVLDIFEVAGLNTKVTICDMVCIVGANVRSLHPLQNEANSSLYTAVGKSGSLCIMSGHSDVGIIVAVEEKKGNDILKTIHELIIQG